MLDQTPTDFQPVAALPALTGYPTTQIPEDATPTAAFPAGVLILNASWRVDGTDGLQWTLEQRRKSGAWDGRKHHTERDCLMVSIRQLCGETDKGASAAIRSWPDLYPYRRDKSARHSIGASAR